MYSYGHLGEVLLRRQSRLSAFIPGHRAEDQRDGRRHLPPEPNEMRNDMNVLVIEDELETATLIKQGLEQHGHVVDHAGSGSEGLRLARSTTYCVLVIDRMLPDLDGLSIVGSLRRAGVPTPVLLLTALSEIDARVAGFEAGADDYLVKPFAFAELLARLGALARRHPQDREAVLRVADLEMDRLRRRVVRAGSEIELQPREFVLLEYLMRNEGRLVTRAMLLENVWDFHFQPRSNIVEAHLSRLRSKIDRGHAVELIQTVRGAGYTIRAPGEPRS